MTTDKTPATLATAKHGGCVQLGDWLLPCPFCGERAERIDFGPGSGDNEGGACVACTVCQHSGPVEFGYKENFISNWNRRARSAQPSPGGQEALAEAARRVISDVDSGDYHGEISEATYAALEAALAARQPVGATVKDSLTVGGGQAVGEPVGCVVEETENDATVCKGVLFATYLLSDSYKPGALLYAAPTVQQPAQAVDLGEIIEQIAQQWDGCNYDAVGETIDVGWAIRAAGKRLIDSQDSSND